MKEDTKALIGAIVTLSIVASVLIFIGFHFGRLSDPSPEEYRETIRLETSTITWISDPIEVSHKLTGQDEHYGLSPDEWGIYADGYIGGTSSNNGDKCVVHAYEPRNEGDWGYMRILGHEMMHCFRGAFHEQPVSILKINL